MAPLVQTLPEAALNKLIKELIGRLGGAIWLERLNPDGTRIEPPPDAEDDEGGNFYTNQSYLELLGRYCRGREWTKYVLNKAYIDSYDAWIEGGCEGTWRHKLTWEMPDGEIRHLHATANLDREAMLIIGRVRDLHGREPAQPSGVREWVLGLVGGLAAGGLMGWLL